MSPFLSNIGDGSLCLPGGIILAVVLACLFWWAMCRAASRH